MRLTLIIIAISIICLTVGAIEAVKAVAPALQQSIAKKVNV